MIVAERKPFAEIAEAAADFHRVLVAGCGTCVAVCLAGGEKEAGILAAQLDMAAQLAGRDQVFETACVERQCDMEFLDELSRQVEEADAVLSLACGAGVQFLAQRFPAAPVLAGVNTAFIGINLAVGVWEEKCRACRDCLLTLTGGICPMALCPKGMINGPCGGAVEGRCETDPERDCAWALIHERLSGVGRLENLSPIQGPRDYSRRNLPGRQVHAAYERRYTVDD
jgi:ferredoxin